MSIDAWRGGTLRYPRVGAGDSLCGRGGVDAREASRRGVGFLFLFATANGICTARGEDDRVSGGGDGKPRATRGAGIIIMWFPRRILGHSAHSEG